MVLTCIPGQLAWRGVHLLVIDEHQLILRVVQVFELGLRPSSARQRRAIKDPMLVPATRKAVSFTSSMRKARKARQARSKNASSALTREIICLIARWLMSLTYMMPCGRAQSRDLSLIHQSQLQILPYDSCGEKISSSRTESYGLVRSRQAKASGAESRGARS